MPTISESQVGLSGGMTHSPLTPSRGGSFAAAGGLPTSPGSGRGSFSGGPAPGEMGAKRASISHRPSLSMGSNGLMMPVKKEVSWACLLRCAARFFFSSFVLFCFQS